MTVQPAQPVRNKWRFPPRTIAMILIGLFLLIQIIPPTWLSQTNPPVLAEPAWDSPQTRALAQRACFDCHSNETKWPIYARIAPVSWLVTRDVVLGREHLNFSEWGTPGAGSEADEAAEEAAEVIQEGSMPLPIYPPLHPEAQLTAAEKQQLMEGLQKSLR